MSIFDRDSWAHRYQRSRSIEALYSLIVERKAPEHKPLVELLTAIGFYQLEHYYRAAVNAYRWELVRILTRYQNRDRVKQAVNDSQADTIEQFCQGYPEWAESIVDDYGVDIEAEHPSEAAAFAARVLKERISAEDLDLSAEATGLREQVEANTENLEFLIAEANNPFN